jgi:cell filamentation protein
MTQRHHPLKGISFCQAIHIDSYLEGIFSKLKNEAFLKGLNKSHMVKKLAYYLGELNAVHPFREGNGRVQRLFLEYLAEMNGYYLDFSKCTSEDMIIASEKSINGDNSNLEIILDNIISEIIGEGETAL